MPRGAAHVHNGFGHENPVNQSKEWFTPKWIFEKLGVEFDTDPAAAPVGWAEWIPAKEKIRREDNGLQRPWRGRVWLNPPYGKDTPEWLRLLAEHGNGIALVFARTDTAWFHDYAAQATLICFMRGRVQFIAGPGASANSGPGSGSMLLAFGPECARIVEQAQLGLNVWLRPQMKG